MQKFTQRSDNQPSQLAASVKNHLKHKNKMIDLPPPVYDAIFSKKQTKKTAQKTQSEISCRLKNWFHRRTFFCRRSVIVCWLVNLAAALIKQKKRSCFSTELRPFRPDQCLKICLSTRKCRYGFSKRWKKVSSSFSHRCLFLLHCYQPDGLQKNDAAFNL